MAHVALLVTGERLPNGNDGVVYAGAARTRDELPEELLARLDRLRATGP